MPNRSKADRSMDALDQEIKRLRVKARQLEEKIDDNFNYFQQHSGSMFVRSLLPRRIEDDEQVTGLRLLDIALQNEKLQGILLKLADILAEKLGDGLNWLTTRVFKK